MRNIWVLDVTCLTKQNTYIECLETFKERIPAERMAKLEVLQSEKAKRECLGAGILLAFLLEEKGQSAKNLSSRVGIHGKPLYEGIDFYVNLSHAGNLVAAIESECENGIDIERIQNRKFAVAKRFFTGQEALKIKEAPKEEQDALFTKIWTLKEAYLKTTGEGLTRELNSFDVLEALEQGARVEDVFLRSYVLEGAVLSYGIKGQEEELNFRYLDLAKKKR